VLPDPPPSGSVLKNRQKETMKRVLFASIQDAGRSQMAAAFFNSFCAPALVKAVSAGRKPADRVQPEVLEAMKEIGFDLRSSRPQLLTDELARSADLVITLAYPEYAVVPGQRRMDWSIHAPEGQTLEQVRRIRDELRSKVWRVVAKEGWYKLQPVTAVRSWGLQTGT
jgi:arsenate reductase (thioredoxin)